MNQTKIKTAILGAGLAGLCAAHTLTTNGINCTLYEAAQTAGGCMQSKNYGAYNLETLYHHCFSGDKTLISLLDTLNLKDDLLWLKGSTGNYAKGKLEPVTTPFEILKWSALTLPQKARLAFFVLSARNIDTDTLDTIPAETYLKEKLGDNIYNAFFAPLLTSKFGNNAHKVSAAWLMSRIAIRSDRSAEGERLGYLKGGWIRLTNALTDTLAQNGCTIHLNTPVTALNYDKPKNKWYINGDEYDAIISTLPPQTLEKLSKTHLPLPKTPYQGAACLTIGIARYRTNAIANGIYWTNMGDKAPYGAVVVHTNFAPFEWYGEQIIYLASYFSEKPDENLKGNMINDFCQRFNVGKTEISHADLYIEPLAGPIFATGYKAQIPPVKLHEGLYAAGMFSRENYPERSMEGSIKAGIRAAETLIKDLKAQQEPALKMITVVIPVYNDADALKNAIPKSLTALEALKKPFELIIAEDESTDGTREIAEEWTKRDPRVRLLHADKREGRGRALNRALAMAKGDIFCYYDVDLATSLDHLAELIHHIEDGAAVATGSRLMEDSSILRSADREFASRNYNRLVRSLLKSKLRDHQCGFKAYRTDALKELVKEIKAPHWFWDTESLILAQRKGLRVDEFPVHWTQGPGTTVRLKDVKAMGLDILHLRKRLNRK